MFKLTVVTPERRLVLDQEIDEVTVPGYRGELNILPGHAPLITTLETGILRWKLKAGTEHVAVISWGYCQVHPTGIEILADIADTPEEVDTNVAQKEIDQAEKRMLNESLPDDVWAETQRQIARRRADLDIAKYKRV